MARRHGGSWNSEPIFDAETGRLSAAVASFFDVSERRKADELLRKLSLVVEQSPVGIAITDTEGALEYVNEAMARASACRRIGCSGGHWNA